MEYPFKHLDVIFWVCISLFLFFLRKTIFFVQVWWVNAWSHLVWNYHISYTQHIQHPLHSWFLSTWESHLFEKVTHILLHIMQGTSYLGKNVIFYPHYNLWLTPTTLDVLLMWDHGIVPKTFWNGSVGAVQAEPFQQAQCYGD